MTCTFLIRNLEGQKANGKKNPINQKSYVSENCPSKLRESLRCSQIKAEQIPNHYTFPTRNAKGRPS
jgi:hypothetical protein